MKIWVATIIRDDDNSHYAAWTEADLHRQLAAYCLVNWDYHELGTGVVPENDRGVITCYFEWISETGGGEYVETSNVEMTDPPDL